MDDPVILVGATGGVGETLARALHAQGRPLHLVARDAGRLADLAAELGATQAVADVLDEAALATAILAAGPRVAGLAYCVGSIVLKPLAKAGAADFIDTFRLNAVGAALAVAAALPALRSAEGSVVLFSSVAARAGFTNHAVIAAAKGAVEGLTLALAAELAPSVRVNAIAPSLTRTAMAAPLTGNPALVKALAAQHPIPRLGEAADIAAMAAFLLSAQAGWITGQVIGVDGGRSSLRGKG